MPGIQVKGGGGNVQSHFEPKLCSDTKHQSVRVCERASAPSVWELVSDSVCLCMTRDTVNWPRPPERWGGYQTRLPPEGTGPPETLVSLRFPSDPHPDPLLHRSDPVSRISHQFCTEFPQKLARLSFFCVFLPNCASALGYIAQHCPRCSLVVVLLPLLRYMQVSGGRAELCTLHVMNAERRQKAEIIYSPLFTAY